MNSYTLKPWTDVVKLHPDVESGNLVEAVFAIDLGAIAAGDPNVPMVNRDPNAFFKATYLTVDLRKLLHETLASLAGQPGFNRVLKLRTPFGGGKSHTLASLLHAARSREALDAIAEAKGFARPEGVKVAVFDGEKFDARQGKKVKDGRIIQTMWGWIAWQFGEDKFALVEEHDRDRVAPGGDVIAEVLSGCPKLLLLDEVLKYMERAAAVSVNDSTLQRQAMDFFQNLTVDVVNTHNCVMAYSLQWSKKEALGNVALLQEMDHLASRVDQLREPVTGDEVLPILQRRLLGAVPSQATAQTVADAYSDVVAGMEKAHAETPSEQRSAEEHAVELRDRMKDAFPFHPALIDVMKDRWCAVDAFQRTRGALRFLASCLHALKQEGGANAVLGPGEVPIKNVDVRVKLLKELGVQNAFDAVISSDIVGSNAKATRIDYRLAKDTPALVSVRPATRIATAILVYSFGGLKREGAGDEDDTLPPGVTERELLAAVVGPGLDNITATAVLSELRNTCLYLHYDGVRYCFKKDPNVTKLVEEAADHVAQRHEEVKQRIREMLDKRLAGHRGVVVWPVQTRDLPDEEPHFLTGYLPLEFAREKKADQETQALDLFANCGDRQRNWRNCVCLAVPDKKQIESLRRAARYLLAIEQVDEKKSQHRLTKEQLSQLRERRRTEEAAAESAMRSLYSAAWLPRFEEGKLGLEKVEVGGRPLQATGVHERVMELLTIIGVKKVHTTVTPQKLMKRVKLGESASPGESPRLGVAANEVRDAFFRFLAPPRLMSDSAIAAAITRGVSEGHFAYTSGAAPELGEDGKFQVNLEKVVFKRPLPSDEVDLDSGFIMMPSAVPEPLKPPACPMCGQMPCVCETPPEACPKCGKLPCECETPPQVCPKCGHDPCVCEAGQKLFNVQFQATRDQVFNAFQAIANLADKSDGGKVTIRIEGTSAEGYDPSWLRNAVEEPLSEADVEMDESS